MVVAPVVLIGVVATCCPNEFIILIEPPFKSEMLLKAILTCVLAGFGDIVIELAYVIGLLYDNCPTLIIKVSVTVMLLKHWLALYKWVISSWVKTRFQKQTSSIMPLKKADFPVPVAWLTAPKIKFWEFNE